MATPIDSQQFESYVPVYDTFPDKWEEAMPLLVEHLKKISNGTNIREIGWYLDEELLSGKAFFPSAVVPGTNNAPQFRSILRKVVDTGALVAGVNPPIPHGIDFSATSNFRLIDLWVAGTNSGTFTARVITGNDVIMNATDLLITSPQVFTMSQAVIEYIQEA